VLKKCLRRFLGQMHGAVSSTSRKRRPPRLDLCDVRTEKQCRDLTAKIGQSASSTHMQSGAGNLRLRNCSGSARTNRRIGNAFGGNAPKDYVRFRLTGERATTWPTLPALCFSMSPIAWSKEMLQAGEIDEHWLPSLHESPAVCGHITIKGARHQFARGHASGLQVQGSSRWRHRMGMSLPERSAPP